MSKATTGSRRIGRRKVDATSETFRIYRNENGGCRGWCVSITLAGTSTTAYFADSDYGSREASLAAAQTVAHKDVELHVEYLALRRRFQPRANSRSGIPGVARFSDIRRGDFWAAYYDDPETGRRRMKRFSVARFGEEPARELAIEFRMESLEPCRRRLAELEATLFAGAETEGSLAPLA